MRYALSNLLTKKKRAVKALQIISFARPHNQKIVSNRTKAKRLT